MQRILLLMAVLAMLISAGCSTTAPPTNIPDSHSTQASHNDNINKDPKPANANLLSADVLEVIDGDTLKVKLNNRVETIRLLLIDTPETKHPSKPVQPFGPEASAYAKEILSGKKVKIEPGISERDKYGRLLAYVWIEDKMVNKMLLKEGLARVAYIFPPNTKYIDDFQQLQKEAQHKGVGIWSIENYAQEDGFHHNRIKQEETASKENGDCTIKGNINSDGEKIYHTPDGAYYEVTKPEKMFCTESEAKKAGFRPSQR
ncbi:thermonuclease family protein [Pseudalkalibacillus caeni]|uniref:Thermonuclease family protein n=1 Tax=Exobacillus caeni TaxID=2574798 RepID=A0A5R9F915_9BACL|nr:thermonuclease family protein [Pseudalkalibacillus caeni]TLS38999.1 thermonuclease family protein [Pseudalkalibacillus caeni]